MATSGTATFTLDVDGLINEALERVTGQTSPGYDARSARRSLNLLFAEWANAGIRLWATSQATQALVSGTASYTLSADTIDIISAFLRRSGSDTDMMKIARGEYDRIPTKTTTGRPIQFYIDRLLVAPVLYLWPVPENSTDTFIYRRQRRIEDALTLGNGADVPIRFMPALVSGLAYHLADKRSDVQPMRREELRQRAASDFAIAAAEDTEKVSLFIRPGRR